LLGRHSELLLILVATVGNVLGSCVNWWLGIKLEAYKDKRWFPVSEKHLLKLKSYMQSMVHPYYYQLGACDW
jgi:membrane protein YqaA with SNARE-associated domain